MYLWSENVTDEVKAKFTRNVKCPVVYVFYNKQGKILYIGKTSTFAARWSQHIRSEKPMLDVVTVALYTFNSAADASFAEAQAIANKRPPWNSHGKDETLSEHKIPWVECVHLKVLTKHLNAFLQKEYALE